MPVIRQGRGRLLITNIADNLEVIAERQRLRRAAGLKRAGMTLAVLAFGVLAGFVALALAFAVRGRAELQRVAQLKQEGEMAFARSNAVLQHQTAMAEAESRVARLFVESGDLADIGQGLLAMLCQWSGALVGAFYVAADDGLRFARISGHGIVRQSHAVDGFAWVKAWQVKAPVPSRRNGCTMCRPTICRWRRSSAIWRPAACWRCRWRAAKAPMP